MKKRSSMDLLTHACKQQRLCHVESPYIEDDSSCVEDKNSNGEDGNDNNADEGETSMNVNVETRIEEGSPEIIQSTHAISGGGSSGGPIINLSIMISRNGTSPTEGREVQIEDEDETKQPGSRSGASMPTPDILQFNKHAGGESGAYETEQNGRRSTATGGSGKKSRAISKVFKKIDEASEADQLKQGKPGVSLYGGKQARASRYLQKVNLTGESDYERSFKITPAAKENIKEMHACMNKISEKLTVALENVLIRNFKCCEEAIGCIEELCTIFQSFITNLRYGPYEHELKRIRQDIIEMLDELEVEPPFLLLRLVEFGWHIYEFSERIRETLLPPEFANLVHAVQSRVYRLQTGRVVRQVYYVPYDLDPVIGTYYKSRRLLRIEAFCHCNIILLPPNDPRCAYCPNDYRTIEVNFDFKKGCYLGFSGLLNACATSKIHTARLAATIFRRLSGIEVDMTPEDMLILETTEPRVTYNEFRSDLVSGRGLALAPKVNSV